MIFEISKLLECEANKVEETAKRIEEINATYYYNPVRGGRSIIVDDDGSYLLLVSSAVSFDEFLNEFKSGRRNGKINILR